MGFLSISPGDLARWAFWVPLRSVLSPENPQGVRLLASAWRVRHALSGAQKRAMDEEFQLCFGESQGLVAEAYRIGVQNHIEELLLGKLSAETWSNYMRFEGLENLEAARERGKGVIVLFPHAGNPEPRLAVPSARVVKADIVGDGHVRAILSGGEGGGRLKAIAFRSATGPLGHAMLATQSAPLHFAGHLRSDTWQGEVRAQLVIDDVAAADSTNRH